MSWRHCALDNAASSFSMSTFPIYLRTRRREWKLSQAELAALLPRAGRNRISDVERGHTKPNASDLLACAFIFDISAENLFPAFAESVQDAVMVGAHRLWQAVEGDDSPEARRKYELVQSMLTRVTSHTLDV
jgi:transcriptional regulator with XRE-family HTH domain